MSNTWGKNIEVTIFGESHGVAVGVIVRGMPAGMLVDMQEVQRELNRRAPGNSEFGTKRSETDIPVILSGMRGQEACGTPICAIFENSNAHSGDYKPMIRPGHADFTAIMKYGEAADLRGGGHFSGRLTAGLVFAGAFAKQVLVQQGVSIGAQILSVGGVEGLRFHPLKVQADKLLRLTYDSFPTLDEEKLPLMQQAIRTAREEGDSVGGTIEVAAVGMPAGVGEPFFSSVESKLAHLLFSIPAVKGVDFGLGFELCETRGSFANDEMIIKDEQPSFLSNHMGGILGGITSGAPIIARVGIKPTPSIARAQQSIDPVSGTDVMLSVTGRHDPCILPRALPVVEAALALTLLDLYLEV